MRKKTVITILSIFLLTILNGCVFTSHTVSEITDADAISQSLDDTNASMQTGPLSWLFGLESVDSIISDRLSIIKILSNQGKSSWKSNSYSFFAL